MESKWMAVGCSWKVHDGAMAREFPPPTRLHNNNNNDNNQKIIIQIKNYVIRL